MIKIAIILTAVLMRMPVKGGTGSFSTGWVSSNKDLFLCPFFDNT